MAEQIEKLAHFIARTQWEDIPGAVQRHAKLVLLDTSGVILAGAEQPEVRRLHHENQRREIKGAREESKETRRAFRAPFNLPTPMLSDKVKA